MWSDWQPQDPGVEFLHNHKTLIWVSINESIILNPQHHQARGIKKHLQDKLSSFSQIQRAISRVNQRSSVSLFVSVFYPFRVFTKPIINPAFQISCPQCPTWADCQNRFVKHRTRLLETQSFLYLCDIYSWHPQKNGDENIYFSQREVSVSFHEHNTQQTPTPHTTCHHSNSLVENLCA